MDSDQYIEQRVEHQLKFYAAAASREKRRHVWTQSVVIAFGALVPVIVNLPDWSSGWFDLSVFARILATVLSHLFCFSASFRAVTCGRRPGDVRSIARRTPPGAAASTKVLKNHKRK